jgi:hypothetical protein
MAGEYYLLNPSSYLSITNGVLVNKSSQIMLASLFTPSMMQPLLAFHLLAKKDFANPFQGLVNWKRKNVYSSCNNSPPYSNKLLSPSLTEAKTAQQKIQNAKT